MDLSALFLSIISLWNVLVADNHYNHHFRAPIIDLGGADEIFGILPEDRTIVSIVPELSIVQDTGPVCRYDLINDTMDEIPFAAEVVDEKRGRGTIRVKNGNLDCSTPQYYFSLYAVRCNDETRSESVPLRISIRDTNNHVPEFGQPWYTFDIDEGKMIPEIARLQANDKDCGHPYGQICRYEITNSLDGFPFAIDDQGVLRSIKPLNYSEGKSYILTIVAHDCGMRQSKSTLVTVNVRKACVGKVHEISERISYYPDAGAKPMASKASIESCAESNSCTVKSVQSVVSLKSRHISLGCDREDILFVIEQSRCGMSSDAVALLPVVNSDQNVASSGDKYAFDGTTNAVIVTRSEVKELIPQKFTLSFAMKHSRGSKFEQTVKQNIICESDFSGMNRHHFAVLIRHCKLEMLLRRESDAEGTFRAAEWRWNISEVCDSQWHTYSILFTSVDVVDLYIDGTKFTVTDDNPEILDDRPLHHTKQTKTRIVIGACWHGRTLTMTQHFKGYLASMWYLPGKVEQTQVLHCAHKCKERLHFTAFDQLVPGEEAIFDQESSVLKLKANTAEDLSLLLRKVSYINLMKSPTPGHRGFEVNTTVNCANDKSYSLAPSKGYIFVQKEVDPVISISGGAIVTTNQQSVKTGARMLPDIEITVTKSANGVEKEKTDISMLDWCKVHLKPSRDMELEYFSSSATLIADSHIDFEHDKQGISLKGTEKATIYRDILAKIHYFNIRADSYDKRIYSVQCGMNSGRILSNEFLTTMIIEAPKSVHSDVGDLLNEVEHGFEQNFDNFGGNRLHNVLELEHPSSHALILDPHIRSEQSLFAALIVVVCVGMLLALLVFGVLRIHDSSKTRKRKNRKNPEVGMEWDNSGMNITVNPLEQVEKTIAEFSDVGSSDEGESGHEMMSEDDEDENENVLPHIQNGIQNNGGLEWDDTTLTNVSHTYRV